MKKLSQRKSLPINASLDHLRKQAKRKAKHNPSLKLAAAQHQVAKEYGFRNWADLSREVRAKAGPTGSKAELTSAIHIGDTERALALLAENPRLMSEKSSDLGFLPLHVASRMANAAVVRWLLDHGADANSVNDMENTALWFVCQSGAEDAARLDVASMLISAGADVNRRCENGSTALCYAAWRGPAAMVELLLAHGARNWVIDDEGKLPIDYARKSNVSQNKEGIISLFRKPRIHSEVFREAVAAITAGESKKLRGILKKHPKLVHDRAEEDGGFAGPYFRHPYLLEFVPENPTRTGKLPANICEIAKAIIDAGAALEAINKTLVLTASGCISRECGVQTELIELLVRHGADPTVGLNDAIREGEWDAAKTLVRLGAHVGLMAAAGLGEVNLTKKLLSSSPKPEEMAEAANAAIRGGHIACVNLLLDAGLPVNSLIPHHPYSPTLLHQAAWFGYSPIARLLLERGADPAARDSQYRGTPANWAHHVGYAELSEWLRSKEQPQLE